MFSTNRNFRASPQMSRVLDDVPVDDKHPGVAKIKVNYPRFYASHAVIINSPNTTINIKTENKTSSHSREEKPNKCPWPFNKCFKR